MFKAEKLHGEQWRIWCAAWPTEGVRNPIGGAAPGTGPPEEEGTTEATEEGRRKRRMTDGRDGRDESGVKSEVGTTEEGWKKERKERRTTRAVDGDGSDGRRGTEAEEGGRRRTTGV